MPIIATTNQTQRELVPVGNHLAICYQMIEIGTVEEIVMNEKKILKKVRIGWELPNETKVFNEEKGEQPFVMSKEYTLSMHEKSTLRADLKSWRGKDFSEDEAKAFDITKLLGKPCMINVIHKPSKDGLKTYSQISAITGVPKGMTVPPQSNRTICLSYDNFDENEFNALPDFIKDKMKTSIEYAAMKQPNHVNMSQAEHVSEPVDDLPF